MARRWSARVRRWAAETEHDAPVQPLGERP
jgi:hypothetical protein